VALRARWVTLRARWVTLTARWVMLTARWVMLTARWVTLTDSLDEEDTPSTRRRESASDTGGGAIGWIEEESATSTHSRPVGRPPPPASEGSEVDPACGADEEGGWDASDSDADGYDYEQGDEPAQVPHHAAAVKRLRIVT
jgi:hypothetical protein